MKNRQKKKHTKSDASQIGIAHMSWHSFWPRERRRIWAYWMNCSWEWFGASS